MNESPPEFYEEMEIKPLRFIPALGFFAIPAGIMTAMYYGLFHIWLGRFGIVNGYFFSFLAATLTILFLAVALFYYEGKENMPATWENLRIRFSLKKLSWNEWKWILIILVFLIPLGIGMSLLNAWLIDALNIPLPFSGNYEAQVNDILLNPTVFQVVMMIVLLTVNVLAEELIFRGFLYPRQEKAHGKWTWVIHGLMWWVVHAYKWFNLPAILFNSLLIPLLWHKTKNTTATLVANFIGSAVSIAFLYIIPFF